jgi:demethylmenaquinone methyltransferase/2-methoxy-6-polyprenyl-1,4-benzoquinol methylase
MSRVAPAPPRLPEGDEKARAVRTMFDTIAPRYDLVNRIMTFRMDVAWRRRTVQALALPPRARVVDLASGTGDLCRELQHADFVAVGVDFSAGMLEAARTTAPLVCADVLTLPLADAAVDGATCGFALRNLVALERFAAELARVVRLGGRIALLETAVPEHALLRWGHSIYFERFVPRLGGWLSDRDAYAYLPRSAAYLPPPHELLQVFVRAGFQDARRTRLSGGIAQIITGTRA